MNVKPTINCQTNYLHRRQSRNTTATNPSIHQFVSCPRNTGKCRLVINSDKRIHRHRIMLALAVRLLGNARLPCLINIHSFIHSFIHSCLLAQTPMYNVNRIMRNAAHKSCAKHL